MYKKILVLLALLLIATTVFAECETTPDKINRFDIEYSLIDETKANALLTMVVEYPENCILNDIDKNSLDQGEEYVVAEVDCPTGFIDPLTAGLGYFPEGLICTTTTIQDMEHLRMTFRGIMQIPAQETGVKTIYFGGTQFTNALPTDSSIKFIIPQTLTFVDNFPVTLEKTSTAINWSPFPKQKIQLSFTPIKETKVIVDPYKPLMDNLIMIMVIIAGIVVLISLIVLFRKPKNIIIQKQAEAPKENKREQAKTLREKIANLEKMYMQGKIDETTYRRLIEQYNLQLNDIIIEIKKEEAKIAS